MTISKDIAEVLLAFYYFDKPERIKWFTNQFNLVFHENVSSQTLQYELAKFKNIDPSHNKKQIVNEPEYINLWNYYIVADRRNELKQKYNAFKKNEFDYIVDELIDEPKTKPNLVEEKRFVFQRDDKVASKALEMAGYTCELECGHELFISKEGVHNYVEGHHLIPLSFQNEFECSLDVEANIISLCPSCHRLLHYGLSCAIYLDILYKARQNRLEKCGIYLTFEDLLKMYSAE